MSDDFESPCPKLPGDPPASWFIKMKWLTTGGTPPASIDSEGLLSEFRANPMADFLKSTQVLCAHIKSPEAQRLVERFADPNSQERLDFYLMSAAILVGHHFIDEIGTSRSTIDRGLTALGRKIFLDRSLR